LPVRSRKAKEGFSAAAEFRANEVGAPPEIIFSSFSLGYF